MSIDQTDIEKVARTLAEGDGHDPDRLMFDVPPQRVRGREGYLVPDAQYCHPIWRAYSNLATEVLIARTEPAQ